MELAEAVRIVREIVRPLAWARERWSAERHCAALEAELVELRAERDTLRAEIKQRDHVEAVNAGWRPKP